MLRPFLKWVDLNVAEGGNQPNFNLRGKVNLIDFSWNDI